MIQFNLLPDVKIAFIKAQRQKRLVMTVSLIASGAAVAVFILLFAFVHGVQKKSINDLTSDIKKESNELIGTPNLNRILTVQNQLKTLNQLHGDKVAASRLFDYLRLVTPTNVSITNLNIQYVDGTVEISGEAPTLAAVNGFADALKYATFTTEESGDTQPAFSNVVLSGFGVADGELATYSFNLGFNPMLFDQSQTIKLDVQKTDNSPGAADPVFQQSGGGQ